MKVVSVQNLTKHYPSFVLDNVGFFLESGRITGFIGRNGSGKTTAIKSMLNLVHPDGGDIEYFGLPFLENETEIKKRIGYSTGAVNWYPRKKIREIVDCTKAFYDCWDEVAYRKYLKMFLLDEEKTPQELSEGMKVKVNLMIALSHRAEVLILDEPTSGLDPFSRSEVLDIFKDLKKEGVSVFFSTHIITDIERCADDIIYISNGKIVDALSKEDFQRKYSQAGESLEEIFLRLERGENNA